MKLFWTSAAALLTIAFLAMPASAQMWTVSAEAVVGLNLHNDLGNEGGSGYSAGVVTPFYLGIGYDNFTFDAEIDDETAEASYEIPSVIVRMPTEMMHVYVSYGEGTAKVGDIEYANGSKFTFDDTSVRKAGFHFGIPVSETFDLRVSYHDIIAGDTDFAFHSGGGAKNDIKDNILGADVVTAGVAVNF